MVGRPSSMKTPCLKAGTRFINEFAEQEREKYRQRKGTYELHQEALKISAKTRKKELEKGADIEIIKRELSALNNLTEQEPILKQYIITPVPLNVNQPVAFS